MRVLWLLLAWTSMTFADDPDVSRSQEAIASLKKALAANPKSGTELAKQDFAKLPLTKEDATAAHKLLINAHIQAIKQSRKQEVTDKKITEDKLEMPYSYTTFGTKPKTGRSLWISLHGGGGAPKQVNDSQWENQKKLYKVDEGIYLAPRAPTNTWNLWHEGHIDRMFTRLIENMIAFEDVNPNRVYVLGYSAGGDGVYQIGPRMADQWAAAAMMAGHPNGVSMLSLRNVPFALQVGGNDAAYKRNQVGKEYGDMLKKLHEEDPKGYEHFVRIREGMGHWMNLKDAEALPWMAKFTRNPIPEKVVWMQTGTAHDRSYWLAVPATEAKVGSLLVAERMGQKINITKADQVKSVIVRLDDRMANLDQPVTIQYAGKPVFTGKPARTIATLLNTLDGRGDSELMFSAEVPITIPPQ